MHVNVAVYELHVTKTEIKTGHSERMKFLVTLAHKYTNTFCFKLISKRHIILQNFISLCFSVFELRESKKKKKMNKTPYHNPIHL